MINAELERAAALYIPLAAAAIARLVQGRRPRQFAACLLSFLWTMPTLLILQRLNLAEHWWAFTGPDISLRGMPLELFLGWAVLWGILPQLAFPDLNILTAAGVMVAVDCILMPLCTATVSLVPRWIAGEAAGVAIVLLPALCLARWTQQNTHLRLRAGMQIATAGLIFLYFIPEICFALRVGPGWAQLTGMPSPVRQLALQALFLLACPGISAVMEFAERGQGTPIPYDPPKQLVTSGIYRYLANPMQASCAVVMLGWAILLQNVWLMLAAGVAVIYSAGIAAWDEGADLQQRFGDDWRNYRASVKNWVPRWKPFHTGPPATLYMAATCQPCSQLRAWLLARKPIGLSIVDAETLACGEIQRMRYDPADGSSSVEGIRAMGRALEHLNLGWAYAGIMLRLPGLWQIIQLVMDAAGFGPRHVIIRQPQSESPTK